jgi:hypothetical protein
VIGFRRIPCDEQLMIRKLASGPAVGASAIAWALGRVGTTAAIPALWPLLDAADETTVDAAAVSLLRLGDVRVIDRAMDEAEEHPWARRALGIGGGSRAVPLLLGVLKTRGPDRDTVLALGLLGGLAAIAPLMKLLEDEDVGQAAAVALNTITGACLHGRAFVPERFDPDALSDEERKAYDTDGTVPMRGGEPYGTWMSGPSRDAARWQSWLAEHKNEFTPGNRWRMGRLYGPSALCESLTCPTSPYAVRSASYEELVIRYRLEVPFEVDLFVRSQSRFLADIAAWGTTTEHEVSPGRWYLNALVQG